MNSNLAHVAGRFGRQAVASDTYVAKLANVPKFSKGQKEAKLAQILSDKTSYMERLGQGMIGPVQLKLRYQGITRNVLLEDPLTKGQDLVYDVLDDLGVAYYLNDNEGEVKARVFEGKRIRYDVFRIASFPKIRKEDLFLLKVNIVEHAQDLTKQDIMKKEDLRTFTLLESALEDYAVNPDHTITPVHSVHETQTYIQPDTLYTAVAQTDMHELECKRLIFNTIDYRDLYRWDINTTGWGFKDRVVAGEKITEFGEFQIQRSIIQTPGRVHMTPEPNFLGVFPVMYSLDVEENHQVEKFYKGWVFDEMVNMLILNPRGIGKIYK